MDIHMMHIFKKKVVKEIKYWNSSEKNSTYLDEVTFIQLYKTFVGSHLEFSNYVWYPL